jgi:anti-sigma-K factor RskA
VNVQEFAELAAGFALNALSPDEARAFEAARAEHPEWDSIVETDAATAASLAESVAEEEPPPHIREALLAQISAARGPASPSLPAPLADLIAEPAAVAAAPIEPPPSTEVIQTVARRTWTRGLLALAASLILLVALGSTAVIIGDRLRAPASVVALDQIEAAADAQSATVAIDAGGTATAHWAESIGKAVLVTDGLDPTSADQTYELWFVRDGAAVSAGVFDTDSAGTATAVLDGSMESGDVIAVTVEPEGGSPTGQPTSDPLFTIPTA